MERVAGGLFVDTLGWSLADVASRCGVEACDANV